MAVTVLREPRARPRSGWGTCTRALCKCRVSDEAIELLAEMTVVVPPNGDGHGDNEIWRWYIVQIVERAMLEEEKR